MRHIQDVPFLIEAKELLASHTYDLGSNKQPDSMKSVNQGQSENQKRNKKETKESDGTIEIPSLSFAQMENRCYACGQQGHTSTKCVHKSKITKEQWAINLAGTRAKSKIMAEHQAQQHTQTGVPSSDGTTTVTTVMTQPIQVPPPQTIQFNENNEIGGWMNTWVGVIDAPTAGVSFSQVHARIREWIILDSQLSIDYFTNS